MFISFTLPIICYGTQLLGIASFVTPKTLSDPHLINGRLDISEIILKET